MRAVVYVCLAVCLFTGARGYSQFPSKGKTSEFRGRLIEGQSYEGLIVEISGTRDRTIRERADVGADGTFAFRAVVDGDYQVRVLTLYGDEVASSYTTIGQSNDLFEIRMPRGKLQKPVSGTVSMQQLTHPLSKQIRKLLESGQKLVDNQDYEDAAIRFRKAAEDDPDCVQAHADLAMALSKLNKWDAAAEEYRAAIVIDPKNSLLHSNLGTALAVTHHLEEAEVEASTALKLNPQNGRAHFLMAGTLLRKHGALTEVVSHLIAAEPTIPSARESLQKVCAAQPVAGCP